MTKLEYVAVSAVAFAACKSSSMPASTQPDVDAAVVDSEDASALDAAPDAGPAYMVFDPADYAGYDPTGATESSAAFQSAIDAASAYAASHGSGLYMPPALVRADGTVIGPNAPQAIVRTRGGAVFLLNNVYLEPNVRLEIDASSTLIPIHADQQVILQGLVHGSTAYLDNVTVTSFGASSTFEDRGRRCQAAGQASPCALPKTVMYSNMTFPDGSDWKSGATDLDKRFVIDLDYRRYPDSTPPQGTGQGPRGSGIKLHQTRYFLVEHVLELAFPGVVLHPQDSPSGPGAIGSNTYPATAGNGFAVDALAGQPPGESAIQPRNGTVRYMHCEGCTRGYGIMEIHAGVDIDYSYISTRGGIAARWESAGGGQSTRQHATQVVGYDCNTPLLMSPHMNQQVDLEGTYIKSIGCDTGFRSESPGGDTKSSSVSQLDVYGGTKAQVILCRFATCDTKYGSVSYDDDAWLFQQSEVAVKNDNARPTTSITISNVRCTARSTFVDDNSGYGACSGL